MASPKLAVDIIVQDVSTDVEGNTSLKYLFVERKYPPLGWALPGGHVDAGETLAEAAVRELKEETGITVLLKDLIFVGYWDDPKRDPRGHVISVAFFANAWRGVPKAADDAKNLKFLTLPEAKDKLAFKDHLDMIITASRTTWL